MEARIEISESRIADLAARFQRFQNRENMRLARTDRDAEGDLLAQAQAILGDGNEKQSSLPLNPADRKLDLWRRAQKIGKGRLPS